MKVCSNNIHIEIVVVRNTGMGFLAKRGIRNSASNPQVALRVHKQMQHEVYTQNLLQPSKPFQQCKQSGYQPSWKSRGSSRGAGGRGRAVVVADLPALAEIVEDGKTGCLYPAGDSQALADTINRLLQDESLRDKLGESAKSWIYKNRTWSNVITQFELGNLVPE